MLKNIALEAKEKAKYQPVIVMVENEGECKKMEKFVVDRVYTFFYDDNNY